MTVLAVATSAYLDLTFVGVPELPRPGEERFATDLVRSAGGGAITAIGAARLGVPTTLAGPLGDDEAGAFVGRALRAEGVATVPPHDGRTPTTVIVPLAGERAMITHDPGVGLRPGDLAALAPRAVVCGLHQLAEVPSDAWTFATCGEDGARAFAGRLPAALADARALLVNEAEARILTGEASPAAAAERLGDAVPTVVVTLGPDGALERSGGRTIHAAGVDVGPAVDTTGAGDLFAAAYVWADLAGASRDARLRWATLYAALSVMSVTGAGGAVTEARLVEEGTRRGLPEPGIPAGHAPSFTPKER